MNTIKMTRNIALILLSIILLNVSITPIQAQGLSLSFDDMNIQPDDVNNYSGVRIIVIFLDSCQACKEEVETTKLIDEEYNVTIFMLNLVQSSDNESNEGFIEETEAPSSWIFGYLTLDSEVFLNISFVPVIIILDDEGVIAADIQGPASYGFVEKCLVNAIEKNSEEYFDDRREDPGGYADLIFIVVGVIISAVVIYFLVKTFTLRKNQSQSNLVDKKDKSKSDEETND